MRIVSINTAELSTIEVGGRTESTGFFKRPVSGGVVAESDGLSGDQRGSQRSELDHAVSVYCQEHYLHWQSAIGRKLSPGAFGENLTMVGATEERVHIGDVWRVGAAVFQVAQPRTPCRKLNSVFAMRLSGSFLESARTGYYLRVLSPGRFDSSDAPELLASEPTAPTIRDFVEGCLIEYWNVERMAWLRRAPGLSSGWDGVLAEKIERAQRFEGWIGLRNLRVQNRQSAGDIIEIELVCPWGLPLPDLLPGAVISLSHRPGIGEHPLRPRSRPYDGPPLREPGSYVARFSERLPGSVAPGALVRTLSPQNTSK